MKQDILLKLRQLDWIMRKDTNSSFSFSNLCGILSDLTASNVYIVNKQGRLLGGYYEIVTQGAMTLYPGTKYNQCKEKHCEIYRTSTDGLSNLGGKEMLDAFIHDVNAGDKCHIKIPITTDKDMLGTIFMTRDSPAFSEEDQVVGELVATITGLKLQRSVNQKYEEEARKDEIVKVAMKALSYSEKEALKRIFEELNGMEGILVASKVANHSRITRSVIITALRKLQSAGIIASKSLGMKGTHIRVLNNKLFGQLDKMKI